MGVLAKRNMKVWYECLKIRELIAGLNGEIEHENISKFDEIIQIKMNRFWNDRGFQIPSAAL